MDNKTKQLNPPDNVAAEVSAIQYLLYYSSKLLKNALVKGEDAMELANFTYKCQDIKKYIENTYGKEE